VTPLAGRRAVVTGATRGIGAATVRALAGAGATVIRVARRFGGGPSPAGTNDVACDLRDARAIVAAADWIIREWGAPDLLVNNAGVFTLKAFERTDLTELDNHLALNLRAPFLLAQQFLPAMRTAGGGLVINIGSVADHTGYPENSAYAASKYGLRGLHETLVAEYRGSTIRFTLVSPGPTDTAAWDPLDPDHRPGFPARKAMLRPEDVAAAVLFAATRPSNVVVDWLRLMPSSVGTEER
jgi:NAD(P)-dependent dehydrogenase (short-subunit alcohol dehydrogenase family)